jgi:CubicO group peptidase (beta-lactamase class C family)
MKKKLIIFTVIGITALISVFIAFPYVGRYFYWNVADLDDYKKFPAFDIKASSHPFRFAESAEQVKINLPSSYDPANKYGKFEDFLEDKGTVAFLVIQDDTIRYEKYFAGYTKKSILPSFSITKAFVSALTGIAVSEGKIKSTDQPVTDFLNGFKNPGFEKITIEHLLNMRSGIRFNEDYYNPFGDIAKFYYGTNLEKYTIHLRIKEPPGLHYDYISANVQILGMIVEKATGEKIAGYLEKKIWDRVGMEYDASWNYDSRGHRMTKFFGCLNGRALDFAKFGRLYLNGGNWEGDQVLPAGWVKKSTSIINDSRDSQGYPYTYGWRILEDRSFFAKGILGQYIYVDPSRKLIMLRFGKKYADIDWVKLFRDINGDGK